jgi:hypothetical protein
MNERATLLAERFLQMHEGVLAVIDQCSDDQWNMMCDEEGESVGVVMHHIAVAYATEVELIRATLAGEPVPGIYTDKALLDQWHAEHAQEFQGCGRDETRALLHQNGSTTASFIAGVDTEQFNVLIHIPQMVEWFEGQPPSIDQIIEDVIIGHPSGHLASIRATMHSEAQPLRS